MKKLLLLFKSFLITLLLLTGLNNIFADEISPVKWEKSIEKLNDYEYNLIFKAKIDAGWHLYGLNIEEGGPLPTSFTFNENKSYELTGKINTSVKAQKKFDETFNMDIELFGDEVTFFQKIKIKENSAQISGFIEFMVCDDSRCLPPKEENFSFTAVGGNKSQSEAKQSSNKQVAVLETNKQDLTDKTDNNKDESDKTEVFRQATDSPLNNQITDSATNNAQNKLSKTEPKEKSSDNEDLPLWLLFLYAIGGGLAAVITPCVYPIIPLTVSFFSSGSKSRVNTLSKALGFGLSLILIYTAVGFFSGLTQIDLMKAITSNWISNLIFFLLFVLFAASFFGAFEITLPNRWANAIDKKADSGGIVGAFFMALATAVVSFSCTGLIAGIILGSALQGDILTPTIGMFGFGFGFALPFTILAFFPTLLKSLPKSGGWLNAVKVVFAFLMLLFSLIFLGLFGKDFIPRDLILAFAVAILVLQGLYLIGKIKFSHDSELPFVSVPRILLAILSWAFAIYLFTGIFGAPLKKISPFLPPKHTLGIQFSSTAINTNTPNNLCTSSPKYSEKLHLPEGLKGYFDWDEALSCAKEKNLPVLIDFVGHYCKNCKKMYEEVWTDQSVKELLSKEFIIVALYTDDNTKLPEDEWIKSERDGRIKNTIGKKNADFQLQKFNSNAQPMYVIVNPNGEILTKSKEYYTYSSDIEAFINFLNEGISEFKKSNHKQKI